MLRLVESSEKALASDSISKEKQDTKQFVKLDVGESYCYYSYMRAPYRVVTPYIRVDDHTRLDVSNDEITRKMCYWCDRQTLMKPYTEFEWCEDCHTSCDFRLRVLAEYYASRLFSRNAVMDASEEQSDAGNITDEINSSEGESLEDESTLKLSEVMDDPEFLRNTKLGIISYELPDVGKSAYEVLDLADDPVRDANAQRKAGGLERRPDDDGGYLIVA